jgi:TonB-linked SusC/RagA family outer membrane protein
MKDILRNISFLSLILFISWQTSAQDRQVSGKVLDNTGLPLPGVTVQVEETSIGTVTDFDGNFSLAVPDDNNTILKFSFLGFASQEIQLGSQSIFEVILKEDAAALDEVIVIGYGTQKKENLTGAVAQINTEDLAASSSDNILRSLQGTLPGLNIKQNSGDPTSTPEINVRGFNSINGGSPLILIDGIQGDITQVNPNDIKSVTVLKDAGSAAIYGARGAFGVILVTTKTAKAGEMQVNYNNRFSITTPTTRTDFVSDPYVFAKTIDAAINGYNGSNYSRYEGIDWETIRMVADGEIEPFHQEQPDGTYKFFHKTDWYDYFFRKWQPTQSHSMSISGGSDKVKGYLSGRTFKRQTIQAIQDAPMRRYNLRAKLNFKPYEWLEISSNTAFTHGIDKEFGGSRGGFGEMWGGTIQRRLYAFNPNFIDGVPVDVGLGRSSGDVGQGRGAALEEGNNWRIWDTENIVNTLSADVSPVKGLELHFDYSNRIDNTVRTYKYSEFDYLANIKLEMQTGGLNRLDEYRWKDRYNALNAFGTYSLSLADKHDFKLLLGYNQEDFDRDRIVAQGLGLVARDKANLGLSTEMLRIDGSAENWGVQGYFGRFNYNYDSKYLLEINARRDGSSRFPENSRWGFFPSVSVGWQMDKESFWTPPVENIISSLKLRGSYGKLGNQTVGINTFSELMRLGVSSWMVDGERIYYAGAPSPLPRNVTWETVKTVNFGVDIGFLQNKLAANFDLYQKDVDGMYLPGEPLPGVFGAAEPRENYAGLRNRGFELTLNYNDNYNVFGSKLSLMVSGTVSNSQGVITKFENPKGLMSSYWEGQKLGEIYGYHVDGQFQSDEEAAAYQYSFDNPSESLSEVYHYIINRLQNDEYRGLRGGDIKYVDIDGDGRIDNGDYTLEDHGDLRPIGNAMPKFPFGFNIRADWKGFDLSVSGVGIGKQDWAPSGNIYWGPYDRPYLSFIRKDLVENAWSPENRDGIYPQINRGYAALGRNRSLYEINDYYLTNIGYLRIANLTLGYTLPQELTQNFKVSKFRVYLSGENILTWRFGDLTKYIDPEQAGSAISYSAPGDAASRADITGYPMGKTFSIGINLSF